MDLKKINMFLLSVSAGIALVFATAPLMGIWPDGPTVVIAREMGGQSFKTKATGSLDEGDVEIRLTPFIDDDRLIVKIAMDTHSVELGRFDLKKIITLENEGVTMKPIEAKRPIGHHSYGKVTFEAGDYLGGFTIRIKGMPPDNQERVYVWQEV